MRDQYLWFPRANQANVELILEGKPRARFPLFLRENRYYKNTTCLRRQVRNHSSGNQYIDLETTALKWLRKKPISQPAKFDAYRFETIRTNVGSRFQWSAEHGLAFRLVVWHKTRHSQGLDRPCLVWVCLGAQASAKYTRQYRFSSSHRALSLPATWIHNVNPKYNPENYVRKTLT